MSRHFRLGVVVNPYAGIGGALALKGSDGADIRQKALAMGAEKLASSKMCRALAYLRGNNQQLTVFTAAGEMGQQACHDAGLECTVVYTPPTQQSEGIDTENAVEALLAQDIDLLLFAGGDGTARNVCHKAENRCAVLGVPAGCKIHSGVYAITPDAAGHVVAKMAQGELVSEINGEVRDIDEDAFRQGNVLARYYGEMRVPDELAYVQAVKMGGKESEELVLMDIADHIIEIMEDNPAVPFIMGSGSTVAAIMERLGLENTLLGVDVVQGMSVIMTDATAFDLQQCVGDNARIVVTVIGGQGHVFGRGNQQLSPALLQQVGRENILLVASKAKLQALEGRPLRLDTGSAQLDSAFAGVITVITGYHDKVIYPIE